MTFRLYKKTTFGFVCVCLLAAAPALAQSTGIVTVQKQNVTLRYKAYATSGSISVFQVRTGAAGTIAGLKVVPGDHVHLGETLATLGGAEMKEVLAADEAAVKTADARYSTAKRLFVIAQKTLSDRLGTRQTLVRAKSDLAAADAARAAATAKLQALQDMAVIKTPVDGTVIALRTSNGARVAVGNAILILRPDDSIWLAASFYGADAAAIHTGMTGIFTPATGEKPVPVVVRSVFNASSPSGGETVGMVPAEKERQLRDGAYGNVALGGHVEKMVVVPTRALVLDRGQWWVLVKTDEGLQRRKVVLGPARGWGTFIKSGLKSGDNVIVDNAYGLFHHGIAAHYQPPD